MNKNVLIVGVGGQGTLLASRILGDVAAGAGFEVKLSEVHGMAQRGGSVVTHVRWGEKVYSPLVDEGMADYILSFEKLEAYRYLNFLKKGGMILSNSQQIPPMPVVTGAVTYPGDITGKLCAECRYKELDALAVAKECGEAKAVNTVLLGVLAKELDFSFEQWVDAIVKRVPPKAKNVNVAAFTAGYELSSKSER